jgi:enamine deaminase RidA (YjgF/YER057c/UK114 family)
MTGQRIRDGGAFENTAGYSRAVRHGNHVSVSGTAALGPEGVLFPGDTYRQTAEALRRALAAAAKLGASPPEVLRTRLLLAPGCDWRAAIRAHGEVFATDRPANTTYFVAGFIPDGVLVEIELDAIIAPESFNSSESDQQM